jgi:hypothetical protein
VWEAPAVATSVAGDDSSNPRAAFDPQACRGERGPTAVDYPGAAAVDDAHTDEGWRLCVAHIEAEASADDRQARPGAANIPSGHAREGIWCGVNGDLVDRGTLRTTHVDTDGAGVAGAEHDVHGL